MTTTTDDDNPNPLGIIWGAEAIRRKLALDTNATLHRLIEDGTLENVVHRVKSEIFAFERDLEEFKEKALDKNKKSL